MYQVGLDLETLDMVEVDPAYRMHLPGTGDVYIQSDLDEMVRSIEAVQPDAGTCFRRFVERAAPAPSSSHRNRCRRVIESFLLR